MECPTCGGPVTMEVGPDQPLSASVTDALLAATEDEQIIVARNCWACGWSEERLVVIDSIEKTEGDADAVERAAFLDDIMREATAIDSLATLEDALAEIRRQRRLETTASDSTDDHDDDKVLLMTDTDALYDVRERTGDPAHASVDDVIAPALERARDPIRTIPTPISTRVWLVSRSICGGWCPHRYSS